MLNTLRTLLARFIGTAPDTATASTTSAQARSIIELFRVDEMGSDLLWAGPTPVCMCGNEVFHALIWFSEDREIGGYFTEMLCAFCGSVLRGVTPVDEVAFP